MSDLNPPVPSPNELHDHRLDARTYVQGPTVVWNGETISKVAKESAEHLNRSYKEDLARRIQLNTDIDQNDDLGNAISPFLGIEKLKDEIDQHVMSNYINTFPPMERISATPGSVFSRIKEKIDLESLSDESTSFNNGSGPEILMDTRGFEVHQYLTTRQRDEILTVLREALNPRVQLRPNLDEMNNEANEIRVRAIERTIYELLHLSPLEKLK